VFRWAFPHGYQNRTPKFPDGLIVFDAHGRGRSGDGRIYREATPYSAFAKIEALLDAHKIQFDQEDAQRVVAGHATDFAEAPAFEAWPILGLRRAQRARMHSSNVVTFSLTLAVDTADGIRPTRAAARTSLGLVPNSRLKARLNSEA
jgi:hypothetical protein